MRPSYQIPGFLCVEPHYLPLVSVRKSAGNARLALKILPFRACITKTMNVHHILFFFAKMVCASPYRLIDCFHQGVSSFFCERSKLFLLHERACIKARELRFAPCPVYASELQYPLDKDDLMSPGKANGAVSHLQQSNNPTTLAEITLEEKTELQPGTAYQKRE